MFEFLMTPDQVKMRDEARELVNGLPREYILDVHADRIKYPREFLAECGRRNLLGLRAPKEYGGRGLKWEDQIILAEELGVPGMIFSCVAGVTGAVVPEALISFGTHAQKLQYLLPICKGEKFAAECLTEPRGGSDFFGATTVARRDGGDFVLQGQKRFIVGGEGADLFLVYAKTNPEGSSRESMSVFMVEREMGVKTEYVYGLMGSRGGGTARVIFDNVRVPRENVIGEVNGAYTVFNQMMIPERLDSSAMIVGTVRPAIEIATDYTSKRKAFGRTINKFQAVSFKVAEAVMKRDSCRGFLYSIARAADSGADPAYCRRLVSEGKKFTTEQCWEIANLCMQVMGGIGYTDVYPVERILRDLRLSMIWVGTNEIMSLIVQHEWYQHRARELAGGSNKRNVELDCVAAFEPGEKIYE
jgi:butyryl-CoA dehydrogenase